MKDTIEYEIGEKVNIILSGITVRTGCIITNKKPTVPDSFDRFKYQVDNKSRWHSPTFGLKPNRERVLMMFEELNQ
jgi:hypothetical protein